MFVTVLRYFWSISLAGLFLKALVMFSPSLPSLYATHIKDVQANS